MPTLEAKPLASDTNLSFSPSTRKKRYAVQPEKVRPMSSNRVDRMGRWSTAVTMVLAK